MNSDFSGTRSGFHYEMRIPSRFRETHRIVHDCATAARAWGLPETDLPGVRLALHEAVVNAMRHGNLLDNRKHVRVAWSLSASKLCIEVEDQGAGFDVDSVEDPTTDANLSRVGGRGVFLMRHFMDRVVFNETGNCVTLEKTIVTKS